MSVLQLLLSRLLTITMITARTYHNRATQQRSVNYHSMPAVKCNNGSGSEEPLQPIEAVDVVASQLSGLLHL